MKPYPFLFVFAYLLSLNVSAQTNTLWYKQPADKFEESMVLGNGKMGASVLGGMATDTIFLNDIFSIYQF